MIVDSFFASVQGIRLVDAPARGASRMNAPVIEDTWNVDDLTRVNLLNATQCKIVILRTLEALSQPTQFTHEFRSIHAQMTDHVMRIEQVLVPFTLEIGFQPLTRDVDLILVRINELSVGSTGKRVDHPEERMFRKQIVMVEKRDEFTRSEFQCAIGSRRDVTMVFAEYDFDSVIFRCIAFQNRTYMGVR